MGVVGLAIKSAVIGAGPSFIGRESEGLLPKRRSCGRSEAVVTTVLRKRKKMTLEAVIFVDIKGP